MTIPYAWRLLLWLLIIEYTNSINDPMNLVLTMYLNAFEEIQRLFEEAFKVIKIYYTRLDDPEIDSRISKELQYIWMGSQL